MNLKDQLDKMASDLLAEVSQSVDTEQKTDVFKAVSTYYLNGVRATKNTKTNKGRTFADLTAGLTEQPKETRQ